MHRTWAVALSVAFRFFIKCLAVSQEVGTHLHYGSLVSRWSRALLLFCTNTLKRWIWIGSDDLRLKGCVKALWLIAHALFGDRIGPVAVMLGQDIIRLVMNKFLVGRSLAIARDNNVRLIFAWLFTPLGLWLRDAEHSHALIDLFLTVNQVFGEGIDPLLFDVIAIAKETVAALGYNELKDVLPHFWLLWGQKT